LVEVHFGVEGIGLLEVVGEVGHGVGVGEEGVLKAGDRGEQVTRSEFQVVVHVVYWHGG
jgi:hypothetical protein